MATSAVSERFRAGNGQEVGVFARISHGVTEFQGPIQVPVSSSPPRMAFLDPRRAFRSAAFHGVRSGTF